MFTYCIGDQVLWNDPFNKGRSEEYTIVNISINEETVYILRNNRGDVVEACADDLDPL